jgi:muconate cycloisomerase
MSTSAVVIESVETFVVRVPMRQELVTSPEFGGHLDVADRYLIRVRSSDGQMGLGEAGPRGAEGIDGIIPRLLGQRVDSLRPRMLELHEPGTVYWQKPMPPNPMHVPEYLQVWRVRHAAQTIVEMALLDLLSRRAGVPMSTMLGGAWRDRVKADFWMGRVTPQKAQEIVRRGMALGFRGAKLKTTLIDPNVERLEAIKEAAPDWHVTVDPNERFFQLDDALPTILAMDAVGNMSILEDPFPRFHLEQFKALRPRIRARVVVHIDPPESLGTVLGSGAAGGLNIDSHTAGLWGWRSAAAAAEAHNLPIWHGSGLDLGVYTAAQLHLAASAPNCTLPGDQVGAWIRQSTLVRQPFVVEDGCILVPPGPGLGVELDDDALDKYTIRKGGRKL